jgi:hypothetical protein
MRSEELQVKEKLQRRKRRRRGGALRSTALFICPALVHPPKSGCLLLHKGGLLLLCARAARMPISFFLPHSLSLSLSLSRARAKAASSSSSFSRHALPACSNPLPRDGGRKVPTYLPTYLPRFSQILAINQK